MKEIQVTLAKETYLETYKVRKHELAKHNIRIKDVIAKIWKDLSLEPARRVTIKANDFNWETDDFIITRNTTDGSTIQIQYYPEISVISISVLKPEVTIEKV